MLEGNGDVYLYKIKHQNRITHCLLSRFVSQEDLRQKRTPYNHFSLFLKSVPVLTAYVVEKIINFAKGRYFIGWASIKVPKRHA